MTHTHHTHFDRRTLFFATANSRSLEAFFFTPVDFLSVYRHDARAPLVAGMLLERIQKT